MLMEKLEQVETFTFKYLEFKIVDDAKCESYQSLNKLLWRHYQNAQGIIRWCTKSNLIRARLSRKDQKMAPANTPVERNMQFKRPVLWQLLLQQATSMIFKNRFNVVMPGSFHNGSINSCEYFAYQIW